MCAKALRNVGAGGGRALPSSVVRPRTMLRLLHGPQTSRMHDRQWCRRFVKENKDRPTRTRVTSQSVSRNANPTRDGTTPGLHTGPPQSLRQPPHHERDAADAQRRQFDDALSSIHRFGSIASEGAPPRSPPRQAPPPTSDLDLVRTARRREPEESPVRWGESESA